jgi:hypothetical protein
MTPFRWGILSRRFWGFMIILEPRLLPIGSRSSRPSSIPSFVLFRTSKLRLPLSLLPETGQELNVSCLGHRPVTFPEYQRPTSLSPCEAQGCLNCKATSLNAAPTTGIWLRISDWPVSCLQSSSHIWTVKNNDTLLSC